jgi:hypothetical protein
MPSPKDIKKIFKATQGTKAGKAMDLEELLATLPKGTKAQQLEAEMMFKRLQEERDALYPKAKPATQQGKTAIDEAKKTLAKKKPVLQKFDPKAELQRQVLEAELEASAPKKIVLSTASSPNKKKQFIEDVYSQYASHPFMPQQRVITEGEGDAQKFAQFELKPGFGKDEVEIDWISAYPNRSGMGTKAIRELQQRAQDAGINLTVYPWDKGNVSQRALTAFYKKLGFQNLPGKSKTMVWRPEAAESVEAAAPAVNTAQALEEELARLQAGKEEFLSPSQIKERLYHATPKDFKEFQGEGFDPTISGEATWLGYDPTYQAAMHNISGRAVPPYREGVNVMPVHVQAKSPLVLDDPVMIDWARQVFAGGSGEFPHLMPKDWVSSIKEAGYDSIIFAPPGSERKHQEVIMLDPKRIKSAIGNEGTYDIENPDITKANGGLAHMAGGGKALKALRGANKAADATQDIQSIVNAGKPLTAAERAMVGKLAEEYTANQPVIKLSEALGNAGAEGKYLRVTQTDRTGARHLGGAPFSMMQKVDPRYAKAKATWGVKTPGAAKNITNQSDADVVWSTLIGSPTQHRSNELIFDKLYKAFQKSAKEGNLSTELRTKFNTALEPIFGEGADILDPKLRKEIDTFEKRAVVGNLLLGEGLGGAQRGGSIIPGMKIMSETTEPMLRDVETFSIGPRLFTLDQGVITRPDLHPAFPEILTGEDLNQLFTPVPNRIALPTFNEDFRARTGRKNPGYYDLTMTPPGQPYPSQFVDEDYLTHLQKESHAKGGVVHMGGGGNPGEVSGDMFKPKPLTIPSPLTDMVDAIKRQFGKEKRSMSKPGAATDVLLRGPLAFAAGTPMDLIGMGADALDYLQTRIPGLRKNASVMDEPRSVVDKRPPDMGYAPKIKFGPDGMMPYGTEHFQEMLNKSGLTTGEERPLLELGTAIVAPGAASKALKYGKAGAQALAPTAMDMMQMSLEKLSDPTRSYVMKPKGGNWFTGSVENKTGMLKKTTNAGTPYEEALAKIEAQYTPEVLSGMDETTRAHIEERVIPRVKHGAALNKWIDKKLNPYIKNEMGTPEDSIRLGIERRAAEAERLKETNQARLDKMAADIERAKAAGKGTAVSERELELAKERFADEEYIASQGLHHDIIPEEGWGGEGFWQPDYDSYLGYIRDKAGFPKKGMATHPASQNWEIKTDAEITTYPAKDLQKPEMADAALVQENQWINKLDPKTNIHRLGGAPIQNLSFDHMVDELQNAMNPASNLPDHLKIATKDLEKMTVDDVSALVGKINAWRSVQKTKSNLEIANNPATHAFKEYPADNNPKGVSWRQIKRPEGYSDEEAEKFVRQAAQYEGDMMRHCVGGAGHCDPLLNGEVEIYTLRDAKGEPHVTIEVEVPDRPYFASGEEFAKLDPATKAEYREYVRQWRQRNPSVEELTDENVYAALREAGVQPVPPRILEIKGKSNRKPKDEFIPFVQDFIRSGNWSGINDLHHTDLYDVAHYSLKDFAPKSFDASPADRLTAIIAAKRAGELTKGLMTREEWEPIVQKYLPQRKAAGGAVAMAAGGAVDYESKFNQMLQDHIAGMAEGGAVDYESRFNNMLQKHVQNMANGGAVKSIWTVN